MQNTPSIVAPYCGQNQTSQIEVPRSIVFQSYQYSPEEGCWVMPAYGWIFGTNSQPAGEAWVPPPVKQADIFLAQQTWPL